MNLRTLAVVPDFRLANHGSICVLYPSNPQAQAWLDEHVINDETQFWHHGVVVEPRYVGDLVAGIRNDGFTVN